MALNLYLLLIGLTYVRPFELFLADLAFLRPMLVLMLLSFAVTSGQIKAGQSVLTSQHKWLLLGLGLCILTSRVLDEGFASGMDAMVTFAPSWLLFYLTAQNIHNMVDLKRVNVVILASLFAMCLMCIACYHTGFMKDQLVMKEVTSTSNPDFVMPLDGINAPADDKSGVYLWRIRSVGFLGDPNDFSQTLVAFIPFLLCFWQPGRKARNYLLIIPVAAVFLYTIYLTKSRGAVLGLGALLFIAFQKRAGTIVAIGLIVGVIVAATALNVTGGREVSAGDESAAGRIEAWAAGIQFVQEHPFFGVGYLRFGKFHSHTAHNTLVVTFGEIGLIGYWVWLGLIYVVWKQFRRLSALVTPGSDQARWLEHLKLSAGGFFTCSMFLSRAFEAPLFIMLGLAIGTLHAAAAAEHDPVKMNVLRQPVSWKLIVPFIMVVSILAVHTFVFIQTRK
jgi:putative inorganic carbon (HCO3(-)) transporter